MDLLVSQVLENCKQYNSKLAIVDDSEEISYADLKEKIFYQAAHLTEKKIANKRVLLKADNSSTFIINYLACHLIGSTCVPLDPDIKSAQLKEIQKDANTDILIEDLDEGKKSLDSLNKLDISKEADILFTSGTTGRRKGVLLTQANIITSARQINEYIGNTSNDVELLVMPFSHSFGLTRMRCALLAGSTCVLLNGLSKPKEFYRLLSERKVTGLGIVPSGWALLRKISRDKISEFKSQIKYIELGSSPMTKEQKKDLMDTLPTTNIVMHYGSTEASRACFLNFTSDVSHLDSVGRPIGKNKILIMDENGKVLENNQVGKIYVEGGMVSPGYLNIKSRKSVQSYHEMGDLGYINSEGYLYLQGRISDIINVGGKKVSPVEIENALKKYPGISDCACTGVPHEISGETIKAFVVGDTFDEKELKKYLMQKLEIYKIPTIFERLDSLPYTDSGKLIRNKI